MRFYAPCNAVNLVMIDEVLLVLKDAVNAHLSASSGWGESQTDQGQVVFIESERVDAADFKLGAVTLMLVNLADGWATRGPGYTRENFRRHCGFVNYVTARAWAVMDEGEGEAPLITGEDLLRELDLEGGRLLGAVLTSVRRAQSEGAITNRDEALALAGELLASMRAEQA